MSRGYIRLTKVTLVLIYLVILAGSIVRTTGSGMGCPDWPKCFGQYIPPTDVNQLPEDYQEVYGEIRAKKISKFATILRFFGIEDVASKLEGDQSLLVEQEFNAANTWTEYGNRLVGFLAGNAVLILFIWTLVRYRTNRKLLLLTFLNLIFIGFEGWFGSIVVATNLLPWTITIHMFFALVILAVQIKIIRMAKNKTYQIKLTPTFKYLFYFSLILTFVQVILGAQVRQEVDFLVIEGIDRSAWIDGAGGDFLLHRSFSWILLLVNVVLLWLNSKHHYGIQSIKYIVILLLTLFITGVLFSYAGMPAIVQTVHFVLATLLLGIQFYSLDFFKYRSESRIR